MIIKVKDIEPEDVRFRTFHVLDQECKKVIGHIIAAVQKLENGNFKIACSFCNPKDQFNRAYGQFIANRRLFFSPPNRGSTVIISRLPDKKVTETIKQGCLYLAAHYPIRWVLEQVDSIDQLK